MVEFLVNQLFLEISIWAVFLGAVFVLIGLFVLRLSYYTTDKTYETKGKIIGALKLSQITKRKDGSIAKNYHRSLVFEYKSPRGEVKRGSSSEWSSSFTKMSTGQRLQIRVIPSQAYDDIYLADRSGTVKFALVMIIIGLSIFLAVTRSPAWWGLFLIISVLFVLLSSIFLNNVDTSKQKIPLGKRFRDEDIIDLESLTLT